MFVKQGEDDALTGEYNVHGGLTLLQNPSSELLKRIAKSGLWELSPQSPPPLRLPWGHGSAAVAGMLTSGTRSNAPEQIHSELCEPRFL